MAHHVNNIILRQRSVWSEKSLSPWRLSLLSNSFHPPHANITAPFSTFQISSRNSKCAFNLNRVGGDIKKPFPVYISPALRSVSQRASPAVAPISPQTKSSDSDVYETFFKSTHSALTEVSQNGVFISTSRMHAITQRLSKELRKHEQTFWQWASSKVGGVQPIDIHRRSKLCHLLFSPTELLSKSKHDSNKFFEKRSAPTKVLNRSTTRRRGTNKGKMDTDFHGLGLIPIVFVKNGSPSLSVGALQAVLDSVRMAKCPEVYDTETVPALEALIQAKQLKTRVGKANKSLLAIGETEHRLALQHRFSGLSVSPIDAWRELALGKDVLGSLSAERGNKLLVLHFNRARMWVIAQLSGCQILRHRVESKSDLDAAAVFLMYEGIGDNIGQAMYLSSEIQSNDDSNTVKVIKELFPIAFNSADRVDSAFRHGGGVGGASLIRSVCGCSWKEAQELRMRWYGGHPGVKQWHEQWRENVLERGMAETMMGQKLALRGATGQGKNMYTRVEKILTEGMRHAIHGSAIEAVMSIVVRLVYNVVLKNYGWRVVLVANESVVLEGPEHSIDAALPIVLSNSAYPFDVRDSVRMNVEVEVVSSLDDLSRIPVEL